MHYTGNGQYHDFSTEITDIRTTFWVVSQDSRLMVQVIVISFAVLPIHIFYNDGNGKFWGQSLLTLTIILVLQNELERHSLRK